VDSVGEPDDAWCEITGAVTVDDERGCQPACSDGDDHDYIGGDYWLRMARFDDDAMEW